MRVIAIIILIVFSLAGFGQQEINYNHKKINKFIKKTYKLNNYKFKEVFSESENQLNGSFFTIESGASSGELIYIGRIKSCRSGGCSIDRDTKDDNYEYFDYIIGFDSNNKIKGIKIYSYQATHGQEVTARWWLKQFYNHRSNKAFEVNKDIDAISGATISVYAMVDDVNYVNQELLKLLKSDNIL